MSDNLQNGVKVRIILTSDLDSQNCFETYILYCAKAKERIIIDLSFAFVDYFPESRPKRLTTTNSEYLKKRECS